MKNRSISFIIFACLMASGCVMYRHVPQTGRDHISGWSDEVRGTADEAWLYAQMANNAYANSPSHPRYHFPDRVSLLDEHDNDEIGFAYAVFRIRRTDGVDETVIAYRGTDNSADWRHGNISAEQNVRGLLVFDEWLQRIGRDAPIVVVGHSLGGGIAVHVSLNRERVRAFSFNGSPRFWREGGPIENDRVSIVEHGEVLKLPRLFGREATQVYTSIGCSNRMDRIEQHAIKRLADCLTQIAAFERPEARA